MDSVIDLDNESVACVVSDGSLYLNNVYTRGCTIAVNSTFHAPILRNTSAKATVFNVLAIGRSPQPEPHAPFSFPVYDEGERILGGALPGDLDGYVGRRLLLKGYCAMRIQFNTSLLVKSVTHDGVIGVLRR